MPLKTNEELETIERETRRAADKAYDAVERIEGELWLARRAWTALSREHYAATQDIADKLAQETVERATVLAEEQAGL